MAKTETKNFLFQLDVVDGWPPVGAESLPFAKTSKGWRLLVPPLYVKKLSVGDVLQIKQRAGNVSSWKHATRSDNTTIWMLTLKAATDKKARVLLHKLNALGCQTVALPKLSSYSISVPATVTIDKVDKILAKRKEDEIAVAYPSLRHAETIDPPPLKDPDNELPVARAWRPIFHRIATAFLHGNYALTRMSDDVRVASKGAAKWIEQSITDYPETLVELSDKTWSSSISLWQNGYWEVLVDLWTAESGRSDLVLHARVYERRGRVRIVVDSVHVPWPHRFVQRRPRRLHVPLLSSSNSRRRSRGRCHRAACQFMPMAKRSRSLTLHSTMATHDQVIERRIEEFLASDEPTFSWVRPAVAEHGFLPLYVGWLSVLGIKPDGSFVRWDHENNPTVVSPITGPLRRIAIAQGCKRYPELNAMLPERPASAVTCGVCAGSGRLPEPWICSCGLGWRIPGEDPGAPTG